MIEDMSVANDNSNSNNNADDDIEVMKINENKIKQWTVKTTDDDNNDMLQEIEGDK